MLLRVHPRMVFEACLALGAAQLAASLLFLLRRLLEPAPGGAAPSAAVVVPCCGAGEGFEENVEAMLAQDYPGPVEFLFVTPSEDDPAHARLKTLMDARCRLLASGLAPTRSSGKIVDVLFALERVRPDAELLAFADADLRVGSDWLRRLAAPLADPAVGAATAFMAYRPEKGGFASHLRTAWMAAGTPFMELMGVATGQSLAMRRADFERLKVAELWSRSLFEDLALHPVLRRAGLKTVFVGGAMPVSGEGTDVRSLLALSLKWVFAFRVYVPLVWALGLGMTLGKAYFLFYALRTPAWRAPILAALYAMDVLNLWVLSAAFRRETGPALALWAPLMAPLVPLVYAYDFAVSPFKRGMRWGRRWYRVRGPQDVEVAA